MKADDKRTITVAEPAAAPFWSHLFGWLAMVPFAGGALLAWLSDAAPFADLTFLWGAAILLFLSGVRRGLSFRTPNGPTAAQLIAMLWLFGLAGGALAVDRYSLDIAGFPPRAEALAMLMAGYVTVWLADPVAARRGEAPLFFERLRPVQMPVAVVSLAALLVAALR